MLVRGDRQLQPPPGLNPKSLALTRDELRTLFEQVGIATDGALRMSYMLMRAELDGVLCSGSRRGK